MFVYFYTVNCSSKSCKHFLTFNGTVVRSNFAILSAVGPILLVLVRSAQTAHVVYTLCTELVFWR